MSLSVLVKPVSGRCNAECCYCFYRDEAYRRKVEQAAVMSEQTLEKLIKKALFSAKESVSFAFQGGEPTLAGLDFYKTAVKLQKAYNNKKLKIFNSIQTNGILINGEWARFFTENGFLTGLSVDGTEKLHNEMRGGGTYEKAIRAAELLTEYKAAFNVLCVVTSGVAQNARAVYENLRKYGYIQFIPCIDPYSGEKHGYSLSAGEYGEFLIKTFELYERDFYAGKYVSIRSFDNYTDILCGREPESCELCGVCGRYCVTESDGSCYPCDFYVYDEWKTGNINTVSFAKIFKNKSSVLFTELGGIVPDKCRECKWRSLCRGGCRRNREPFVNGQPSVNSFCKGYKAFFDSCFDRMVKMAEKIKLMTNNR